MSTLVTSPIRDAVPNPLIARLSLTSNEPYPIIVVSDGEVLIHLLQSLGMHVWFRYQKFREEFASEDATIALDETPIGTFVEIEGGERAILSLTTALGRSPSDFILDSYRGLFLTKRDEFGLQGANMVFADEWSLRSS